MTGLFTISASGNSPEAKHGQTPIQMCMHPHRHATSPHMKGAPVKSDYFICQEEVSSAVKNWTDSPVFPTIDSLRADSPRGITVEVCFPRTSRLARLEGAARSHAWNSLALSGSQKTAAMNSFNIGEIMRRWEPCIHNRWFALVSLWWGGF